MQGWEEQAGQGMLGGQRTGNKRGSAPRRHIEQMSVKRRMGQSFATMGTVGEFVRRYGEDKGLKKSIGHIKSSYSRSVSTKIRFVKKSIGLRFVTTNTGTRSKSVSKTRG